MAHDSYPRGASFGGKVVPVDWTLQNGSRAQRRRLLRELKREEVRAKQNLTQEGKGCK